MEICRKFVTKSFHKKSFWTTWIINELITWACVMIIMFGDFRQFSAKIGVFLQMKQCDHPLFAQTFCNFVK
jgi:hypothetical protein